LIENNKINKIKIREIIETLAIIISLFLSIYNLLYEKEKDRETEEIANNVKIEAKYMVMQASWPIIVKKRITSYSEYVYSLYNCRFSISNVGGKDLIVYGANVETNTINDITFSGDIENSDLIYSFNINKDNQEIKFPFTLHPNDVVLIEIKPLFSFGKEISEKLSLDNNLKKIYDDGVKISFDEMLIIYKKCNIILSNGIYYNGKEIDENIRKISIVLKDSSKMGNTFDYFMNSQKIVYRYLKENKQNIEIFN